MFTKQIKLYFNFPNLKNNNQISTMDYTNLTLMYLCNMYTETCLTSIEVLVPIFSQLFSILKVAAYSTWCYWVLLLFDICLRRCNLKKDSVRWYMMHILTNAIVCLYTYQDMINLIRNPLMTDTKSDNEVNVARNVIFTLHIYHLLHFQIYKQ